MRIGRTGGLAMVAVGGCLTLAGAIGLAVARTGASHVAVTTTGPATTTGTGTTTVSAPESPAVFLGELGAAIRTGDAAFLLARLHPAVIQRFGTAACRAAVATLRDPTARFTVTRVGAAITYAWTTDTRTTEVPATLPVSVDRVSAGRTSAAVVHLTPVAGHMRWFLNCGAAGGRA